MFKLIDIPALFHLLLEEKDDLSRLPMQTNEQIQHIRQAAARIDFILRHKGIHLLNKKIEEYNNLSTPDEKIRAIHDLHTEYIELHQNILNMLPDPNERVASLCNDIFIELRKEIEKQYDELGILFPDTPKDFLSKMSPHKFFQMLEHLLNGKKIDNLYEKENTLESNAFRRFLTNHTITFLGGGNSRSYQIKSTTGETLILRIANPEMSQPLKVITHLEGTSVRHFLAQVYLCRECGGLPVSLIEYCNQGDLYSNAATHQTVSEHVKATLKRFTQMVELFQQIENAGCVFPDAKNQNILISQDRLVIADTKSLVPAYRGTRLDPTSLNEQRYELFLSPHMLSPELWEAKINGTYCEIKPLHVFFWGKNLYAFLTQKPLENAINPVSNEIEYPLILAQSNGARFDFNSPIFQTLEGKLFKSLIEKTVKPNPAERITLVEVLIELDNIRKISELHEACQKIMAEVGASKHLDADENPLLDQIKSMIDKATTTNELVMHLDFLKGLQWKLQEKEKSIAHVSHFKTEIEGGRNLEEQNEHVITTSTISSKN